MRSNALYIIVLTALLVGCGSPPPTPGLATPTTADSIPGATLQPTQDIFAAARLSMVREQIELRGVDDAAVLDAMRQVERHIFVPQDYLDQAYDDHPLPIGFGQTISQPYIVALMTRELGVQARRPGAGDRHRQWLPGGSPGADGYRGIYHRDRT